MKLGCVLVTHLGAKVEMLRRPHLKDRPVLIVDRSQGRQVVIDHFPAACGMPAGTSLEEAVSYHPGSVVLDADTPAYRAAFEQVITGLQGVSDRVEAADLGTAYVGLDGLEGMYGGEARLVSTLLNSVPSYLSPRIGVAQEKFPALVAASSSRPLGATKVPPEAAAFLAPHPIGLLPVNSEVKTSMYRLGLRTLGDLAALSKEALTDRFGPEGARAWDLAQGTDHRPLRPLKQEERMVERTALPAGVVSLEMLLMAVDLLLRRAYAQPLMQGRYAGQAGLECLLPRCLTWERSFHFKDGVSRWEQASSILRARLEADHPQALIEEVTLTLSSLTWESGVQGSLFSEVRGDRDKQLARAAQQLMPHMEGRPALYRVATIAPWHPAPELRAMQIPIGPTGGEALKPLGTPVSVAVQEGPGCTPAAVRQDNRWHQVACIDDQWCFDLWWMPEPIDRHYYCISREDGRHTTLFRDQSTGSWYRQNP